MIISVSRRTDIPAYFNKWFLNSLNKGEISVKNPFNPNQITTVSLKPESVTAFIFWTRNSQPFIPVIHELLKRKYCFYFLYTITPYQFPLETNLPSVQKQIADFCHLSELIGKEKTIWRYDPIIISNHTNFEYHINRFKSITEALKNYTNEVKISFVDYYRKTDRHFKSLEEKGWNFIRYPENQSGFDLFISQLSQIAHNQNLLITSCSEKIDLSTTEIKKGSCIDIQLLNRIYNLGLTYKKDPNQRNECKCSVSKDIGKYNTCKSGCIYCYAT